jgi:Ni/Co efflux regulator RcnB
MKKVLLTAAALAVAGTAAFAEPNDEATPTTDNNPAAQAPAPKVAKKHHKHHKHHKEKKTEKQSKQKPANDQNEQSK